MKIQDFIKEKHYYGYKKGGCTIYFRAWHVKDNSILDYMSVGAKCIKHFRKDDYFEGRFTIIKSGCEGSLNITQKDLDSGRIWKATKEEIIEAVVNVAKNSLIDF